MKDIIHMTFLSSQEEEFTKSLSKAVTFKDKKVNIQFQTTIHQSSIQTFTFLYALYSHVQINFVESTRFYFMQSNFF